MTSSANGSVADHDHTHPHEHPHTHTHRDASAVGDNPRPTEASESVFIDVDETRGALLLQSTAEREGLEPEIYPAGSPAGRTHVWVLPRKVGSGITYAAIFPSLVAGDYVIVGPDGVTEREVTVTPGEVTVAAWG